MGAVFVGAISRTALAANMSFLFSAHLSKQKDKESPALRHKASSGQKNEWGLDGSVET